MRVKTATGEIITLNKNQVKGDAILYGVNSEGQTTGVLPEEIVEILQITFWELLKGWVTQLFKLIFK
jgi:uncharacterized phosphosugar-binding protein